MKKTIAVIFMFFCICFSSGCNYLIPGQIKREASLMNLNIKTALKEIEEIDKSDKSEDQKLKERSEKAVRALKRAGPHTENINNYVNGRPATK